MTLLSDLLKVTDATLGRAVCLALAPLAWRRATGEVKRPRRVLVIRPGGIGDAVLFVPMLRALRSAWPEVEIDLLAERRNSGAVIKTGLVTRVLHYDRPLSELPAVIRTRYDLVVDTEQYHRLSAVLAFLTGAPRRIGFGTNMRRLMLTETIPYDQERYEAEMFLQLAALATAEEPRFDAGDPFYPVSDSAREFARATLAPLAGRPLVAIHPGASIPERRWPAERYARVASLLVEQGAGIVILGSRQDCEAAMRIAAPLDGSAHVLLAGRCDLEQVAGIVAACDLYISADSGVLHLAYGVGTPSVHLFGPGVLSKWGPPGPLFRSIRADVPCSPCTTYGYTPPCCQGVVCMLKIEPEQVFEAARAALSERIPAERR